MLQNKNDSVYKVSISQALATADFIPMISPYAVLEANWINAALLMGLKQEPWNSTISVFEPYPPYIDIWLSLGLMRVIDPEDTVHAALELTKEGKVIVALRGLFEYEQSMIEQQLSGEYVTDPFKYTGLRLALAKYSEIFLTETTKYLKSFVAKDSNVLDYGGGAGYYLQHAMENAVNGHGVLLDKAPNMALASQYNIDVVQHNFTSDNKLFTDIFADKFDVVILSEVAHCLNKNDLVTTFENIYNTLKTGGVMVLIEQHHNFRLNQRLFDMTTGGRCYNPDELTLVLDSIGLQVEVTPFNENSHYTLVAKKVKL